jgi:subfamily B ATP-binding cassette protein MsbA
VPAVPIIIALGLVASILEGAGIGLIIPLLGAMLATPEVTGVPQPLQSVSDMVIHYSPETKIVILGSAIIALIAIKGAVQSANGCFVAAVDTRISRDIRNALSARLLRVDYSFFIANDPARLSKILTSDSWFVAEAVRWALALIPASVTVVVFGILLAWLNLTLFLMVVAGAIVVQLTLLLFERRQRQLSGRTTASDRFVWVRMRTIIEASRLLRIFGQEETEQSKFAAAAEGYRSNVCSGRNLSSFVTPTMDVIVAVLFVLIVLAGHWRGESLPAITAFLVLLTRLQRPATVIRNSRLSIASVQGSIGEVGWLLGHPLKPQARVARVHGVIDLDRIDLGSPISFDQVTYAYPNGSVALNEATFTIPPGTTALMGKSGSGKTTIVNLLCRLVEPQSGAIAVGDVPFDAIDAERWRSRVAVAGQDVALVAGTVAENIAFCRPEATLEEIKQAAAAAGAADFIAALPLGYRTQVGENGSNLSGGQRQRIGLARALLRLPELLILDEATSALDAMTESEMFRRLSNGSYLRSVIVISHRKSTLAACRHGIVVNRGRICESGPLESLAYFRMMAGMADAAK